MLNKIRQFVSGSPKFEPLRHHFWRKNYWNSQERLFYSNKETLLGDTLPVVPNFSTQIYRTTNIGDEIQSIAHQRFLPNNRSIGLCVRDRRDLSVQTSQTSTLIANGWYSHVKDGIIYHNNIRPLFFSAHVKSIDVLTPNVVDYLKDNQPIGCRDLTTLRLIEDKGISGYFSKCLTLTLGNPYGKNAERSGVIVVDAHLNDDASYPPGAASMMKRLVPGEITHGSLNVEQERWSSSNKYSQKFWQAEELLSRYAKAQLVITSRLHCALPCLAMGTPVIFIHPKYHEDTRFAGLREILNGYGPDDQELRGDPMSMQAPDLSVEKADIKLNLARRLLEKMK